VPAAALKAGRDPSVSVRGSSLKSPSANSFSAYLKDALLQDLRWEFRKAVAPTEKAATAGQ